MITLRIAGLQFIELMDSESNSKLYENYGLGWGLLCSGYRKSFDSAGVTNVALGPYITYAICLKLVVVIPLL